MSYSFSVKAATKPEAKAAVAAEIDRVIGAQPIHARDKAAAIVNASAVIDLLADDVAGGHVIAVSCNGYVGWQEVLREDCSNPLISASVSAAASYVLASS